MGAGHGGVAALHVAGDSPVHRLPAAAKIVATGVFVVAVVATPPRSLWAFAGHAVLLAVVVRVAAVPAGFVVRRLRVELPFVAFALFLPLLGRGPHVEVGFVHLSEPGLWAAWAVLAKATLGVGASILLAATTEFTELLRGFERLRVPPVLVAITAFMVRYLVVITDEAARMRVARASRGHDPRWLWQARAVAATAGTLFVRSYGRGERVHLAMLARGYDGAMPDVHGPPLHHGPAPTRRWAVAVVPLGAVALMVAARVVAG